MMGICLLTLCGFEGFSWNELAFHHVLYELYELDENVRIIVVIEGLHEITYVHEIGSEMGK
jgi:hypothetical protein